MEFIIGPLLAICASVAYSASAVASLRQKNAAIVDKIEKLEERLDASDTQTLQKVMTTMMPLAKAVSKLNNEVGIR